MQTQILTFSEMDCGARKQRGSIPDTTEPITIIKRMKELLAVIETTEITNPHSIHCGKKRILQFLVYFSKHPDISPMDAVNYFKRHIN